MSIRPYLFYKNSELEKLKVVFEGRVAEWAKNWLAVASETGVSTVTRFESANDLRGSGANYLQLDYEGDAEVLLRCDDRSIADLSTRLLQKKRKLTAVKPKVTKLGRLEERLVYRALKSLVADLAENNKVRAINDSEVVGKWHDQREISEGHLLITVSIGQHELDVVIPPQIADAMMSRNYKDQAGEPFYQDDVKKLLTTGEVRCEVSLGGAGISLDELMSLQVGDVVKLNTSLNDPCDLKFDGATDSVKCLLGKKDDHIAVKIVGQGV